MQIFRQFLISLCGKLDAKNIKWRVLCFIYVAPPDCLNSGCVIEKTDSDLRLEHCIPFNCGYTTECLCACDKDLDCWFQYLLFKNWAPDLRFIKIVEMDNEFLPSCLQEPWEARSPFTISALKIVAMPIACKFCEFK